MQPGKEKGALEVGFKAGSYLGSSQGLREGGCSHMNGAIAPKRTACPRGRYAGHSLPTKELAEILYNIETTKDMMLGRTQI